MLAAITSRPGEVVRRRTVVAAAWPDGATVSENTVDSLHPPGPDQARVDRLAGHDRDRARRRVPADVRSAAPGAPPFLPAPDRGPDDLRHRVRDAPAHRRAAARPGRPQPGQRGPRAGGPCRRRQRLGGRRERRRPARRLDDRARHRRRRLRRDRAPPSAGPSPRASGTPTRPWQRRARRSTGPSTGTACSPGPSPRPGGTAGVVVVSERLAPYEAAERYALIVSLVTGVLATAAAAAIAAWVTSRALAPVAVLSPDRRRVERARPGAALRARSAHQRDHRPGRDAGHPPGQGVRRDPLRAAAHLRARPRAAHPPHRRPGDGRPRAPRRGPVPATCARRWRRSPPLRAAWPPPSRRSSRWPGPRRGRGMPRPARWPTSSTRCSARWRTTGWTWSSRWPTSASRPRRRSWPGP